MKFFLLLILFLLISTLLFFHLIQQSKQPKGIIGKWMMTIWNKSYLPMVRWSIFLLPQQKPKNILDIGVGNGLSTTFLADTFSNSNVYGIDLSAEAIKASQSRKSSFNHSILFSQQSINHTTFSTRQFQLITAFQTHFHWENIGECFEELYRILDNDGILLISCEFAKLAYFLKHFTNIKNFESFLEERGFILHSVEKKNEWISYIIYKKT